MFTPTACPAMRLNSLLGLGGNGKAAQDPPSKRQKRSDVLDSLGLGAPSMKVTQSKPSRPASMLSMPGVPTPSMSSMSSMNSSKEPLTAAAPAAALAAPAAAPAAPATAPAAPAAAPAAPAAVPAEPAADGLSGSNVDHVQRAQAQAWRSAFAEATNQWFVSDKGERCFYHDTEKDLFFEWDQAEGLLFQYFSGEGEKEMERAPIWSAECPETHAEVWQVLPMPPTDPNSQLGQAAEAKSEAGEEVVAPAEVAPQVAPDAPSMMPPPPKKKKLPPVPIMAQSGPEDDDEDEGDLKLPESRSLPSVVMGCEGPPQQSSSSSLGHQASQDEEPDDEDPGGRSLVLEEGEEVDDLAAEDCALPQAPEPVDFIATDLELDIFG